MHIPDGFLSAGVAAVTWTAGGVAVAAALRAERREPQSMPAGILGALAAFVFAAQMVNVPVAPGTSGHLVGAVLAALLVGPWRAVLVMAVVLAVQALLFQDGGLAAYGANLIDMGVAAVLAGYTVTQLTRRAVPGIRGIAVGGVIGAFVATLAGATCTGTWLGLSGIYPLRILLAVLLSVHVVIGLLEAALTGAILVTLLRWRPDLVAGMGGSRREPRRGAAALGALAVAVTVAGLIAPFASPLPDGLERTAEMLGFNHRESPWWPAPLVDYTLPFASSLAVAPAVAGILGTCLAALIGWLLSRALSAPDDANHA